MRKRGEMTRSYARGMVALIFFVLAVQVAIFTIKSYEKREEEREERSVRLEREELGQEERKSDDAGYKRAAYKKVTDKKNFIREGNNEIKQSSEGGTEKAEIIKENNEPGYVPVDIRSLTSSARLELNSADSADLVSLPGIGPFFASKILDYRKRLGGFAFKEQLLEVYGLDKERFSVFGEKIWADTSLISKVKVSEATQEELSANPYIGAYAARAIIKFREVEAGKTITLAALAANRIIKEELVKILKYYLE